MPISAKRGGILAKIETNYGTDSVPTGAANAIAVMNPQYTTDVTIVERDQILRDSLSRLSFVVGRKLARLTFGVEMKGSGTAGTAARHGALLRACGLSETVVAVTSVTYAPINTGFESVTIYWYDGEKLHKLTGAFCTMRIVEEVGQFGRYEFTATGIWNQPTDAAVPSMTLDTTKPQPVINLGLTLGGYSPVAATLNIDLGVQVSERLDFNATEGLRGLLVTGRAVAGSIDPETTTEAVNPWYANMKNATEVALAGNLVGATAGNKVAVTSPKIQFEAPAPGERNSLRILNIPIRFNPSTDALNDEVSLVYT
jgi:hypothetical protein